MIVYFNICFTCNVSRNYRSFPGNKFCVCGLINAPLTANKIMIYLSELGALRGRQARLESAVDQERSAFKEAERRRERLHRALATVDARLHQEAQLREATSREADASETQLLAKLHVGFKSGSNINCCESA